MRSFRTFVSVLICLSIIAAPVQAYQLPISAAAEKALSRVTNYSPKSAYRDFFGIPGSHLAKTLSNALAHQEKTQKLRNLTSGELVTGEQFDQALNNYYLRARYYDQGVGRFGGMDSFPGVNAGPNSLHKYLYANGDPVNGMDPSGYVTLTELAITTGVFAVLANTAITSYSVGRIGLDSDGLPDGVTVSFRVGAARGVGGSVGADLVYDFRTGELWGFGAIEATVAPLTVFRPQAKTSFSVTAGFVWNMNSPKDFNGGGASATWPIASAHLLARARRVSLEAKGGFWGFLTQTAKLAKSRRNWSLQFGFSGFAANGPAFARIGPGSSFSSDLFGLAEGRRITGTRPSIVKGIESIMSSLRGSNSPESLSNAIQKIESL